METQNNENQAGAQAAPEAQGEAPKEKKQVLAWNYSLRDNKGWLGQIVLTSDGMFAAVTDWGNMSFAWRAFGAGVDFRDFILSLGPDYFSSKMATGAAYAFGTSRKIYTACDKFTMMILPALKDAIRAEKAEGAA